MVEERLQAQESRAPFVGLGEVVGRRVHRIRGEKSWSAHRSGPGDFPPGRSILYKITGYTIIILILHQRVAAILPLQFGPELNKGRADVGPLESSRLPGCSIAPNLWPKIGTRSQFCMLCSEGKRHPLQHPPATGSATGQRGNAERKMRVLCPLLRAAGHALIQRGRAQSLVCPPRPGVAEPGAKGVPIFATLLPLFATKPR